MKAELKTKESQASVEKFIMSLKDEKKIANANKIISMMKSVSKVEPKMWGKSIIGFGNVRLKYASGRELDWLVIGFSPRKEHFVLYILCGLEDKELMEKLGKYKKGKGCLYIKRLSDVDEKVLKQVIKNSYAGMKRAAKRKL
ncbi:MAG: DUF1801 domain-containing protein [Ignavibacteria bacterium]|nr:DUF1801 domain-containing protein [Ignavibacteria bacterium]